MPLKFEIQHSDDKPCISAEDTSSTCVPDCMSEDWEWKDSQYTKDTRPKKRNLQVMGWKGPLTYRYLDDDGCLNDDDPWPVPITTQHTGPLVRIICGSMELKFVDVIDDISAHDATCMEKLLDREHRTSLWDCLNTTWGVPLLLGEFLGIKVTKITSVWHQ